MRLKQEPRPLIKSINDKTMNKRTWIPVILNGVPQAMKVKHLIKALQECDQEAYVGAAKEPIRSDVDLQSMVVTEVVFEEAGPVLVIDQKFD